jgi:glutaredoxin 3
MYSTPWCGYCAAARELLNARNIKFEDIDVSMDAKQRRKMVELSGETTVPQIFVDDKPVGGYDEISTLDSTGELANMLAPGAGNQAT